MVRFSECGKILLNWLKDGQGQLLCNSAHFHLNSKSAVSNVPQLGAFDLNFVKNMKSGES